ncbi:myosin, partial [Thraustotheca clavata]
TSMNQACETPLSVHVRTATKDDPLVLEKLLEYGADPNCLVHAISVLHLAIDRGFFNMACRLIRYGARLDAKDGHGRMVFEKMNQRACNRLFAHISTRLPWIPDTDRKHYIIVGIVEDLYALLVLQLLCN